MLRPVDFPELGLQISGETVESQEAPIAAAREAFEETGLTALGLPEFLGVKVLESERDDDGLL